MAKRITSGPDHYRKRYTPHDIRRLRAMREAGKGFHEIGRALSRSPGSCQATASQYGIYLQKTIKARRRGRKYIPCLKCRNPFESEGPHNRLCESCRHVSPSPFETPVTLFR